MDPKIVKSPNWPCAGLRKVDSPGGIDLRDGPMGAFAPSATSANLKDIFDTGVIDSLKSGNFTPVTPHSKFLSISMEMAILDGFR